MLAFVPIKALVAAKMRLSSVLTPGERGQFVLAMAKDLLGELCLTKGIDRVVVCAGDAIIESMARRFGVEVVRDQHLGGKDLNELCYAFWQRAVLQGEHSILIAHADVPRLKAEDIQLLICSLDEADVVAVPDVKMDGTNVLAYRTRHRLPMSYGARSFSRYQAYAAAHSLTFSVCKLPRLRQDIDTPQDLESLAVMAEDMPLTNTRQFLAESGIRDRILNARFCM